MRLLPDMYRDCWLLLRFAHVPLPRPLYLPLQLTMAAGVAAVVLAGRLRRWPPAELLRRLFDLGCCWMILFGPATENSTYILVAPTCAFAVWDAFAQRRPVWTRAMAVAIVCIFAGSTLITALPGGRNWSYPLNPLATLLLAVERLASLRRLGRSEPEAHAVPAPRAA